jgi:two-component system response regulator AtoC
LPTETTNESGKEFGNVAGGQNPQVVFGTSPALQLLEQTLISIAPTDIPILLIGETGTGKKSIAAEIHRLSRRRSEQFVRVGCATLTAELLDRWFGAAHNGNGDEPSSGVGTVLFDEIVDLDSPCQAKLLQALLSGNGGAGDGNPWPRVISTTSRNLEEEVSKGHFNEELYYRLKGISLGLSPLRHRKADIPFLLDFFLRRYAGLFGRPLPMVSANTLHRLLDYAWPGNVRELENVALKIVALGDEHAGTADLGPAPAPARTAAVPEGLSLKQAARTASRQAERELILRVLERTHWNRKRAARELQISYKALLYKLKQLALGDSTAGS